MSEDVPGKLAAAELTDRELRESVNHVTRARAHAVREAARLRPLATRAGAEPGIGDVVERYERQAAVLEGELGSLREALRAHQVTLEGLRATASGA